MSDSTGALRSLFGRTALYVGQDNARSHLLELIAAVRAATPGERSCRTLYLEVGGGFGKTHFLNSLSRFLEAYDHELAGKALLGPRIDMADFESLIPTTIEATIIDGLSQQLDAPNPDGVDRRRHTAAVKAYQSARLRFFQGRTSSFASRTKLAEQRRTAFTACLNAFSRDGLLVLRFDTLERLFLTVDAPQQSLVKTRLLSASNEPIAGPDRFLRWLADVLPALERTVVVFAGRPLPQGMAHPLITRLEKAGVMTEETDRIRLNKLSDLNDVVDFLEANGLRVVDEAPLDGDDQAPPIMRKDLPTIIELTDGSPLLLTAWIGLYRGWPNQLLGVDSPSALSELIADLLFNPSRETPPETDPNLDFPADLAYVYSILYYTRRGITREDLARILEKKQLFEVADAQATINRLLDEISEHAWVIEVGRGKSELQKQPLLLLHDELWRIADESQNPRRFGLAGALDDLADLCREQLLAAWQTSDETQTLRPLSDYLFYTLWRDFDTGYRFYTVYVDRALRLRLVEEALMLAEIFWSVQQLPLFKDRLSEARFLSEASILRDESVRQLRLLRALDEKPEEIRNLADMLYASFAGQPVEGAKSLSEAEIAALKLDRNKPLFVDEKLVSLSRPPSDPQLFVELALVLSWVLMLASRVKDTDRAEGLLRRVIALLDSEPAFATALNESFDMSMLGKGRLERDNLLILLRRSVLLGQAHLALGQLYHYEQRYHLSMKHAAYAEEAFERYKDTPLRISFSILDRLSNDRSDEGSEPGRRCDDFQRFCESYSGGAPSPLAYFCDNIDPDLAQARNNLAYAKARVGDFADAMERVEALKQDITEAPTAPEQAAPATTSRRQERRLSITPWQKVLLVNTRAQILVDRGLTAERLKQARTYVDEAIRLLFNEGDPLVPIGRVTGLALLTQAQVEHAELLNSWDGELAHDPAKIDRDSFRQALGYFSQDRRGLIEAHYARVRFLRSMGRLAAKLQDAGPGNPDLLAALTNWLASYLRSRDGQQQLKWLPSELLQPQRIIAQWNERERHDDSSGTVAEIGADMLCWCLALAEWHETREQIRRPPEQNRDPELKLLEANLWATEGSIYIWLGEYVRAEESLRESERLMDQQMPSFGQVVYAKIAFQYGLLVLRRHGPLKLALLAFLSAFARSRLFSAEGRERLAFRYLLGETIEREQGRRPSLVDQLGEHLIELQQKEPPRLGNLGYRDVPLDFSFVYYQRPPMERWPLVWNDALRTVRELLVHRGWRPTV